MWDMGRNGSKHVPLMIKWDTPGLEVKNIVYNVYEVLVILSEQYLPVVFRYPHGRGVRVSLIFRSLYKGVCLLALEA